jgi:hypothetical protein
MPRNNRRVLYSPAYIAGFRRALQEARADLADLDFRHRCALAILRHELDETHAAFDELRAAVRARQHAEMELEQLKQLDQLVRLERDPTVPLQ